MMKYKNWFTVKCDDENNPKEMREQRKFVITIIPNNSIAAGMLESAIKGDVYEERGKKTREDGRPCNEESRSRYEGSIRSGIN